jgi:hypothetical protein
MATLDTILCVVQTSQELIFDALLALTRNRQARSHERPFPK